MYKYFLLYIWAGMVQQIHDLNQIEILCVCCTFTNNDVGPRKGKVVEGTQHHGSIGAEGEDGGSRMWLPG